jgi:preprotein translocase subunit SecG
MVTFLYVLYSLVCIFLILVVLLQAGRGGMGSAFGGSSQTVFGGSGAGNFLTKLTTASALIFMVTSMSLAWIANRSGTSDIFESKAATVKPAPAEAPPTADGSAPAADGFQELKPAEPAKPEATAPEAKAPVTAPAAPVAPIQGGAAKP